MTDHLEKLFDEASDVIEVPPADYDSVQRGGQRRRWRLIGSSIAVASVVLGGLFALLPSESRGDRSLAPISLASDSVVSLNPDRVSPGHRAELVVVDPPPGIHGMRWDVDRFSGETWESVGFLLEGSTARFYSHSDPDAPHSINDIGLGAGETPWVIPSLEPGLYRVGTDFIKEGRPDVPIEDRTERHYAQFEILEPGNAIPEPTPVIEYLVTGGWGDITHEMVIFENGEARVSEGEGSGLRIADFSVPAEKLAGLRALLDDAPWPEVGTTTFGPPENVVVSDGFEFKVTYDGASVDGTEGRTYQPGWLREILDELSRLKNANLPSKTQAGSEECPEGIEGKGLELVEHYPPKPYFESFNLWRSQTGTGRTAVCLSIVAGQYQSHASEGEDDPTRYEPNGWLFLFGDYRHDNDGIGTREVPLPRPVRVVTYYGRGYNAVLRLQSLKDCSTIAYDVSSATFKPDTFRGILPCHLSSP